MNGPRSLPVVGDLNRQVPQPGKSANTNQSPVVLLNGLPLQSNYLAKCRLCMSNNFGENSISIMDKRFSHMLSHVFRFSITCRTGFSLNVCTKCYKGVELFYGYTFQVLENQRAMERALKVSVKAQLPKQTKLPTPSVPKKRVKRISNVVEIVRHDELQNRKDDNIILDVDMQCEAVEDDEEDSRDSLPQSSHNEEIQTHFVEVPGVADIFFDTEADGFERVAKRGTKPVEDAPFVIEIISASDEEYEMNEEDNSTKNHINNRTTHLHKQQTDSPAVIAQSNGRSSSHANPPAVSLKKVQNTLEKPKQYFATGQILPYVETNANKGTKDRISSRMIDKGAINALASRRGVRNIMKQQDATKPAGHYPRRSFN